MLDEPTVSSNHKVLEVVQVVAAAVADEVDPNRSSSLHDGPLATTEVSFRNLEKKTNWTSGVWLEYTRFFSRVWTPEIEVK